MSKAWILIMLCALVPVAIAQDTPEEAAAQLVRAFSANDYEAAARLMDPDALREFRGLVLEIARLDDSDTILEVLTGASHAEELADVDDSSIFARFLTAMTGFQPGLADALGSIEAELIGVVNEDDSLAHVLTRNRMTMMGISVEKVEVTSTRRRGDRWYALLSQDVTFFAETIRARLRDAEGPE